MGKKKKHRKKKITDPVELGKKRGMMIVTILAFVGFMFTIISDVKYFTTFGSYLNGDLDDFPEIIGNLQAQFDGYQAMGGDISKQAIESYRNMFVFLTFVDVIGLLGVMLFFFKVPYGFKVYMAAQISYIFLPIAAGGLIFYPNFLPLGYFGLFLTLFMMLLYGIQQKAQFNDAK